MKINDCLFSDIQNLCNAVSNWLVKKISNPLKPTRQYPMPVVTSCVITAEPVKEEAFRKPRFATIAIGESCTCI